MFGGDKVNTIPRPRPLDAERAAHARRRHDGVCGVRPGAGAYGAGGEDDEGVDEHGGFVFLNTDDFLNTDLHGLDG